MDSRTRERSPSPDAVEFVRFCYRRRRVGWPELYDEMCAVASRGLFRGWGSEELGAEGIAFGLFEMPSLAALVHHVIAEEHDRRLAAAASVRISSQVDAATTSTSGDASTDTPATVRFAPVPAGA
jgi:hypothetical protein